MLKTDKIKKLEEQLRSEKAKEKKRIIEINNLIMLPIIKKLEKDKDFQRIFFNFLKEQNLEKPIKILQDNYTFSLE